MTIYDRKCLIRLSVRYIHIAVYFQIVLAKRSNAFQRYVKAHVLLTIVFKTT